MRITEQAVLLSTHHGRKNLSCETREQNQYYRQMDKYALPGIVAVDSKPYKVLFDWFEQHQYSEDVIDSVYRALKDRCAGYKSYLPKRHPFQDHSSSEEVLDFKSEDEVKRVATDMAKIVANLLAKQANKLNQQRLLLA